MNWAEGKDRAIEILNNALNNVKKVFKGLPAYFTPGNLTAEKRRVLFALGGSGCLIIVFLVVIVAINAGSKTSGTKKGPAFIAAAGSAIPADELFIPSEPDFVPEFLLERNPRSNWSIEDIRSYWKNPGAGIDSGSPGWWQGAVRSAVDELMQGVP